MGQLECAGEPEHPSAEYQGRLSAGVDRRRAPELSSTAVVDGEGRAPRAAELSERPRAKIYERQKLLHRSKNVNEGANKRRQVNGKERKCR